MEIIVEDQILDSVQVNIKINEEEISILKTLT